MYPKDKKTAALMSESIREILANPSIMNAIIEKSDSKPAYWDMLPEKNGITAIVIAQMLKAMAGDTAAFTALSKFGFGEKVQMDISDFYRTDTIKISVVKPEALDSGEENKDEEEGVIDGDYEVSTGSDVESDEPVGEDGEA